MADPRMADSTVKSAVETRIRNATDELVALSHRIHAHPELAFEEFRASAWVAEALHHAGFDVQHGCYELPTAIRATAGSGPVRVAICAEYDALPDMGHACGHNMIAAAAVGAGLGLADFVDELGLTVTVLGTPAEEGGGGKALMLDRGAFEGLDAAMMVHPATTEMTAMPGTAVSQVDVTYTGKPAHAGAYPEEGINAADAMTIAQVAIGLLRQQTRNEDRIAGVVHAAGSAANIIPESASGHWVLRSDTAEALSTLKDRVLRCFEAGATATGCDLTVSGAAPDYADLRPDAELLTFYQANAEAIGRIFPQIPDGFAGAATDMGNVSHLVPTIHPMIGIETAQAVNHQPEFTAACITPSADRAVIESAIAMAWTAVDLATTRQT